MLNELTPFFLVGRIDTHLKPYGAVSNAWHDGVLGRCTVSNRLPNFVPARKVRPPGVVRDIYRLMLQTSF